MAQHDYVIANGTGAAVRSDLNNALAAIVSQNSGPVAPTTTYAYMPWADTGSSPPVFKIRNAANNGWITLYELDGTFSIEAGSASSPGLYFTGDTNTGIYSPGADQFGISTGGTSRLVIDSSGNVNVDSGTFYVDAANNRVGIGTTAPSQLFHLAANNCNLYLQPVSNAEARIQAEGGTAGTGTAITFHNYNGSANGERARIDSSGRLLVGTSDGSGGVSKLIVQGASNGSAVGVAQISYNGLSSAALATDTDIGYLRFTDQGSNSGVFAQITASTDGTTGANDYPGRLVFSTTADGASSPTERMRISQAGRVSIGTTGSIYNARITAISESGVSGSAFATDTATEYGTILRNTATSGNNGFALFETEATPTTRGSITYNRGGGVVAYNTTSDYRSKTILGSIENAGETIDAFKVYRGIMNGATIERPMLVAHEAQAVAPYCVTGEKDAVDDDGNPIYQQMDHQVLVPLLIAEIQQLRARVAVLEAA